MSLKWPIILLLAAVPLVIIYARSKRKPLRKPRFVAESSEIKKLPSYKKIANRDKKLKVIERTFLAITMLGLLVLAARPVMPVDTFNEESSKDIVFLIDVSGSVNKYIAPLLDSAEKEIKEHPENRYAIVTFAGMHRTVVPLTRDQVALNEKIEQLRQLSAQNKDTVNQLDALVGFGTDIGEGILGAINRFTDLETYKSRSIVLLSNLENSGGNLDPNTEFYLEKVSLLPKYSIDFLVLKAPPKNPDAVNNEIAEFGGAKVFDITSSNPDESVRLAAEEVFGQTLGTSQRNNKNTIDYPSPILLANTIFAGLWVVFLALRWRGR